MKIAFTNFLTTLRRYKTASVLNIAGLTLAFFAMYVIAVQVMHYASFHHTIKDHEQIYVLSDYRKSENEWRMMVGREYAEAAIEQCPEVEIGGMIQSPAEHKIWIEKGNISTKYTCKIGFASEQWLDVLSFEAVAGDLKEFSLPNSVILSQSEAKRLGVGVGDYIKMPNISSNRNMLEDDKPEIEVKVVAIYRNFAHNTIMAPYGMLKDIGNEELNTRWISSSCIFFIKFKEGAFTQNFIDIYKRLWRERFYNYEIGDEEYIAKQLSGYECVPITQMQWMNYYYKMNKGIALHNPLTLYAVIGIALLIVLMAFINFVNFFFALVPVRLRAVNISKVFGASTWTLRWSFVFEAVGFVVCALLLTSYFSFGLMDISLAEYIDSPLQVSQNPLALLVVVVIGVVMAVVAALYPAWYITSFNPALAVKAGFAGSSHGKRIRMGLICIQFTISMTLIVVTIFFFMQYRYMVNFNLGFEPENILTFTSSYDLSKKRNVVVEELKRNHNIADVATSERQMFRHPLFNQLHLYNPITDKNVASNSSSDPKISIMGVSPNFFSVMGIKLVQGEWLGEEDEVSQIIYEDAKGLMNITDAQRYGIWIGDNVNYKTNGTAKEIKGYIEDVRIQSIEYGDVPTIFVVSRNNHCAYYVRLQPTANIEEVKNYIRTVVAQLDPMADEPTIEFFSQVVEEQYQNTRKQSLVVGCFALVAIVISLMGVFGIVLFETQHRRREIAIRRVFGATTSGLLWMFNSRYAKIVVACFIAAVPMAWYVVDRWLQKFPERVDMEWWVFVVAFVIVMGITLTLVTTRSWRAANENPADVVKGE